MALGEKLGGTSARLSCSGRSGAGLRGWAWALLWTRVQVFGITENCILVCSACSHNGLGNK